MILGGTVGILGTVTDLIGIHLIIHGIPRGITITITDSMVGIHRVIIITTQLIIISAKQSTEPIMIIDLETTTAEEIIYQIEQRVIQARQIDHPVYPNQEANLQ